MAGGVCPHGFGSALLSIGAFPAFRMYFFPLSFVGFGRDHLHINGHRALGSVPRGKREVL